MVGVWKAIERRKSNQINKTFSWRVLLMKTGVIMRTKKSIFEEMNECVNDIWTDVHVD